GTRQTVGTRRRLLLRPAAIHTSTPSPCDVQQCRTPWRAGDPALNHLWDRLLGEGTKAVTITSDRLDRYILARQAEGAAVATIRIELALLSKGFTLAVRARKLRMKPYIPKPEGDPSRVRHGFFTRDQVEALCTHLSPDLADVVQFLFF